MPDDDRSTQIERSINRDVTEHMNIVPDGGRVFTLAPRSMTEVLEFAKLMAVSGICIRPMFRGNPGACLALTLQAMKWGADPFAVANKAFEVNGQLSYEAQLIHAIVNSSSALTGRLNATYSGEGPSRQCLVVGIIKGESEAREYLSPKLAEINPKNSPLWKTDPDQQLFYYSTRSWARRWVPEVLLGIYTPDEIGRTIEMVPAEEPQREDFIEAKPEPEPEKSAPRRRQPKPTPPPTHTADGEPIPETKTVTQAAGGTTLLYPERAAVTNVAGYELTPISPQPAAQPWPGDEPETDRASDEFEERAAIREYEGGLSRIAAEALAHADVKGEPPNDDPERGSLAINPPIRRGQPDWRTWMIALLLPKVRQAQTTPQLAFLLGDNDENLTAARATLDRSDIATLEEAIALRWKEIGDA